ncbi:stage III sporulation protein AG [Clostridiaceae bacterium 14S0207]|nr:stage III sporulation protein AG [Clostridiaceae bacterium 14S0207]
MDEFFQKVKDAIKSISDKKINKKEDNNKNKNKKNNFTNMFILILVGVFLLMSVGVFSKHKAAPTMAELSANKNKESKDPDENLKLDNNEENKGSKDVQKYGEELNEKLKRILGLIDGVGRIESMIYFESGEQYVPAININNAISATEETDTNGGKRKINQNNDGKTIVTFNEKDSTKPLITETKAPKITGVCVVAEGATDKVTQLRIVQAVVNLFNLPENKVQVYPMKK